MRAFIKLLSVLVLLTAAELKAKSPDPICLLRKCGASMLSCGVETECASWLQCVIQCGDDKVRCPSFCGFYYQSSKINQTSSCIFASQCVELGFSQFPDYQHGARPIESLHGIEGRYWFVASYGGQQIFDYDCQRFDFATQGDELTRVNFSVPLTRKGEARIKSAAGVFRPMPSGAVEVVYDNFVGYHENWYMSFKSQDLVLAHVCIGASVACYDYGTIVLAKKDLEQIDPEQIEALANAASEQFGLKLENFKRSGIKNCANGN